jgi:hypothetical protein
MRTPIITEWDRPRFIWVTAFEDVDWIQIQDVDWVDIQIISWWTDNLVPKITTTWA